MIPGVAAHELHLLTMQQLRRVRQLLRRTEVDVRGVAAVVVKAKHLDVT